VAATPSPNGKALGFFAHAPVDLAAHAPAKMTRDTPRVRTICAKVVAPYQLATRDGRIYVADGGTSLVSRVRRNSLETLGRVPQSGEVAGVAAWGTAVAWTATDFATGATTLTIKDGKKAPVVADLSGHEARSNPDGGVSYGVDKPSKCVSDALGPQACQETKITAEGAAALGLPKCAIGVTYAFEPVPTDVEVGPDGKLYVSTLPGGPESPALGARGSVYKVDPYKGTSQRVATGFLGATNLTVGRDGTIYVAELFAGRISSVKGGKTSTYVNLPGVLSLATGSERIYAGTLAPFDEQGNPAGTGSVVQIRP